MGKAELKNSARRSGAPAGRSCRSHHLHRLGRSARIQPGRHGHRRMRRRSRLVRWILAWPPPSAKCSRRRLPWKPARSSRPVSSAWRAMLHAAKGLVSMEFADISDDPDRIVDGIPHPFLRYAEILRSLCGRQIRAIFLRGSREGGQSRTRKIQRASGLTRRICSSRPLTAATSASARCRRPLHPGQGDLGLMELQHVNVKLRIADPGGVDLAPLDSRISQLDSGPNLRRSAAGHRRLPPRARRTGRRAHRSGRRLQRGRCR